MSNDAAREVLHWQVPSCKQLLAPASATAGETPLPVGEDPRGMLPAGTSPDTSTRRRRLGELDLRTRLPSNRHLARRSALALAPAHKPCPARQPPRFSLLPVPMQRRSTSPPSQPPPAGSDGSDVNAAHQSADGKLLLTADDFGTLKLFHCPCVVEDAPYRAATGHCSHLSCARFLRGDGHCVSSGGSDRTVMLWQLCNAAGEGDSFRSTPRPLARAAWRSNGHGQASAPGPGRGPGRGRGAGGRVRSR